jgi:hypothetical protein
VDNETYRICQQLAQAFDGNAWHGPSVREILTDVDPRVAAAHPVPGAHSIWEIVLHLVSTQQVLLRRLDGDKSAINLPHAEEWPAVTEMDETGWRNTLEKLVAGDRVLRDRIAAFPPDQLDESLIPGGSSAYNNFHGYVQHNLYHAAQIGLLKKMQGAQHAAAKPTSPERNCARRYRRLLRRSR